jgi:DNA-binding transcriptional ArsR family regulator
MAITLPPRTPSRPNRDPEALDAIFRALAHPVRRAVVHRLARGPGATSELAQPFDMALPSFVQHMGVLAEAGLVESEKEGRTRCWRLTPDRFRTAEGWMAQQRRLWELRLDQLDRYLLDLEDQESDE